LIGNGHNRFITRNNGVTGIQITSIALLGSLFDPEDGGVMFLHNVG
jgi:hypothetical protein